MFFFWPVRTRPFSKKYRFLPDKGGHPLGVCLLHTSMYFCGAVNCERSRYLPTGKCDTTSGKSVGCGRVVPWKGNSSDGVMKTRMREPESGLPTQRNVLNERGRVHPEGTQEGASIPLLFSTGNAQTSRNLYVYHDLSHTR